MSSSLKKSRMLHRRGSFLRTKRLHFESEEEKMIQDLSPRRTRSGKVYDQQIRGDESRGGSEMIEKRTLPKPVFEIDDSFRSFSTPKPSPKKNGTFGLFEEEEYEYDEEEENRHPVLLSVPSYDEPSSPIAPPKLNYSRRIVSRIRGGGSGGGGGGGCPPSSPPTHGVMSLRLFDGGSSPHLSRTLGPSHLKPNVLFDDSRHNRSEPRIPSKRPSQDSLHLPPKANYNPFTPEALFLNHKRRSKPLLHPIRMDVSSPGGSFSELQKSLDQMSDISDDNDSSCYDLQPPCAKRIRVSDIHISRYNKEFVELNVLASGEYGCVKVARHRLDGMVYAIKVTKKVIQPNSHEEHVAMNEVFAHAAMMKHKHVIRYYNSWVENCQVYIQTEYCEGGSLQSQINAYKKKNRRFPESELKSILTQIAKGLHYIHTKDLAHMDIKPENIFISLEHPSSPNASPGGSVITGDGGVARHSGNESTDSGNHSGNDNAVRGGIGILRGNERLTYKIGDLGNIAQIHGDELPEEGDCRYMAPELFAVNVDRSKLTKADVFSLGLSLYATASLTDLPKNSMDDSVMYDRIKRGDLPYLDYYSKEFNQVLKMMVSPDPVARPTPNKLMTVFQNNSNYAVKSRSQLCKELKDCEMRIRQLEELLNQSQASSSFSIMDNSISLLSNQNVQTSPIPLNALSSKVTSTPNVANRNPSGRAVGKGAIKSSSCIL